MSKKMTLQDYQNELMKLNILAAINPFAVGTAKFMLDLHFEANSDYEKVEVEKYGIVSNGWNERVGKYKTYEWRLKRKEK